MFDSQVALLNQFSSFASRLQLTILGVWQVPQAKRFSREFGGLQWVFRMLGGDSSVVIPQSIEIRLHQFEKELQQIDLSISHWLLGTNSLRDMSDVTMMQNLMLVVVIPLKNSERGLWISLGRWQNNGHHSQKYVEQVQQITDYSDIQTDIHIFNSAIPIINAYQEREVMLLGIEEVFSVMVELDLDGVRWEIGPVVQIEGRQYNLHPEVKETFRLLKKDLAAAGLNFSFYMWGDVKKEHTSDTMPRLTYDDQTQNLEWVRPLEKLPANMRCIYDPILIGIIMINARKGMWIKIGAWFD